jgi:hypothetical protein
LKDRKNRNDDRHISQKPREYEPSISTRKGTFWPEERGRARLSVRLPAAPAKTATS